MSPVHAALAAMAYLLTKHAVADFALQTPLMRRGKAIYGAPGGLLHATTHVLLTAPVFLLFPGGGWGLAAALLAGEFIVHYHLDWGKEQVVRYFGWTVTDRRYWCALGLDQLLHGLTYVAVLCLWMPAG